MKREKYHHQESAAADKAAQWLIRLNSGPLSKESIFEFEDWLNESPENERCFKELSQIWMAADHLTFQFKTSLRQSPSLLSMCYAWFQINPARAMRFSAITFAVCFVLATSFVFFANPWLQKNSFDEIYAETPVGESESVDLSDGSEILLNTHSKIHAQYKSDERTVILYHGEAHFNVEPDSDRPFRVITPSGTIEAVGTAFNVRIIDDKVDVVVTEGLVKLERNESQNPSEAQPTHKNKEENTSIALVGPGQSATLKLAELIVEPVLPFQVKKELSWQNGSLLFDGDTLENVVSEFQRYVDQSILISDNSIRNKKIVGYFPSNDVDQFLEVLNLSFGINSEIQTSGTILLYER